MGRLYDADLRAEPPPQRQGPPWRSAIDTGNTRGRLRFARDTEDGSPCLVASTPAAQAVKATPVTWQETHWDYAEPEENIQIRLNRWVDLSETRGECHFWSGIEVTIPSQRLKKLSSANTGRIFLVAALYPAEVNWFAFAPFRRTYKDKDRQEKIRNTPDLRTLSWDPIQTNSAMYTARLDDPRRLDWDRGLNLGSGYLLSKHSIAIANKHANGKLVWSFGLVPESCLRDFKLLDATGNRGHWMALAGRAEGDTIGLQEAIESWV